jgi:anti-sigma factor RsiW
MCDDSGKLVAFLDHELDDVEMARIERHLEGCADCRIQLNKYKWASNSFRAYCDAIVMAEHARRERPRWRVLVISGAAVTALAAAMVLLLLSHRVETPKTPASVNAAAAVASETAPVLEPSLAPGASHPVHRRQVAPRVRTQAVEWVPAEPAIEIAIPADSMFPPGAVPDGFSFTADVSFAPDGSAQQMRLRPRLVSFEKGAPQP